MCVAAPDLKTIIMQYRSEKDGRAALLHVRMATETEYFVLKGVTLVLKTMTTQVSAGKVDPTVVFDRIKEQWDMYNMMKPKRPLDTTTVAAFAVTTLCDNPLYANLTILHPNLDDITFEDLKALVMKYYWMYVKHS